MGQAKAKSEELDPGWIVVVAETQVLEPSVSSQDVHQQEAVIQSGAELEPRHSDMRWRYFNWHLNHQAKRPFPYMSENTVFG